MDEGTATVIASVVAASGSVAVAWITSRPKQPAPTPAQGESFSATAQEVKPGWDPPPAPAQNLANHRVATVFLWFLYFLTGVFLIVCGSENDVNPQESQVAAGFAIMFGIAAYLIRRRIRKG